MFSMARSSYSSIKVSTNYPPFFLSFIIRLFADNFNAVSWQYHVTGNLFVRTTEKKKAPAFFKASAIWYARLESNGRNRSCAGSAMRDRFKRKAAGSTAKRKHPLYSKRVQSGTPDWSRTSGLQSRSYQAVNEKACICKAFVGCVQISRL